MFDTKLDSRFWSKVSRVQASGCWVWLGAKSKGYGSFYYSREKTRLAHRLAYLALRGPIPEGKELDHLCRNSSCVNPAHLEVVTHHENCIRGVGPATNRKLQLAKTHCPKGHSYNNRNTYYYRRKTHVNRGCRQCRRQATVRWERRQEASIV